VVGALSSIIFTVIVIFSSYITTYFMSVFEEPSWSSDSYFFYSYYISPWDVAKDLIRAALRILKDENGFDFDEGALFTRTTTKVNVPPVVAPTPPGVLRRLIKRFILGLPIVGAGALIQMLLSLPFLGPVHWLARYRGNRSRRGDTRDAASMVVIVLLLIGAARHVVFCQLSRF
jgi:hypothetical protein